MMQELSIDFDSCSDVEKVVICVGILEKVQNFLDTSDLRFIASEDLRSLERRISTVIVGINHVNDKALVPVRVRRYILQNIRNARNELFNALDSQEYTEKDRRLFYRCLTLCQDYLSDAVWRLRPVASTTKESESPALEPIALATLNKALDFFFDQAVTIIKEIRTTLQSIGRNEYPLSAKPKGNFITTRKELESLQPKTILLKDFQEEIEHCLNQIYMYRSNQRITLEQIAHVGGLAHASHNQHNDLISECGEIKKFLQKLKNMIQQVYDQTIYLDGLE